MSFATLLAYTSTLNLYNCTGTCVIGREINPSPHAARLDGPQVLQLFEVRNKFVLDLLKLVRFIVDELINRSGRCPRHTITTQVITDVDLEVLADLDLSSRHFGGCVGVFGEYFLAEMGCSLVNSFLASLTPVV